MIFTMPPFTPVSTPVDGPMIAINGFPELQVPPVSVLVSDIEFPLQKGTTPAIGGGSGFTVTVVNTEQPDPIV
jgi:hypothetical protein